MFPFGVPFGGFRFLTTTAKMTNNHQAQTSASKQPNDQPTKQTTKQPQQQHNPWRFRHKLRDKSILILCLPGCAFRLRIFLFCRFRGKPIGQPTILGGEGSDSPPAKKKKREKSQQAKKANKQTKKDRPPGGCVSLGMFWPERLKPRKVFPASDPRELRQARQSGAGAHAQGASFFIGKGPKQGCGIKGFLQPLL